MYVYIRYLEEILIIIIHVIQKNIFNAKFIIIIVYQHVIIIYCSCILLYTVYYVFCYIHYIMYQNIYHVNHCTVYREYQ